jgi:uncharacterized protein YyaL (SSP411 family)
MTRSPRKNRLAQEGSPYLRQHETNPVDWFPWGDEAFTKAKTEDKPILLSIGYSACHWCHVMAHECFEDEAIAAKMNELFVNVKVDREERPDLDQIHQLCVQLMGRSGGWPLTVFLTPDRQPFYAGTYFPPTDRHGLPAFPKILDAIAAAYRDRRAEVAEQAESLTKAIADAVAGEAKTDGEAPTPDLIDRASKTLSKRFDDKHGGFGARPKFPNPMALDVLLRHSVEPVRDLHAEGRVKRALGAMRTGGIYDHLGGGFHRYSTDERWLVPHFEKMLYDNALLARLYVDAARAYGEPKYEAVAHDVLKWVAREMTAASGAFFSTQDADSVAKGGAADAHATEGAFFVWTPSEIRAALPGDPEAAEVALLHFGVTEFGNFVDPHHEDPPGAEGRSVLHEALGIEEVGSRLGIAADAARAARDRAIRAMAKWREERPRPFRDEKLIASWNGLMIGACAEVAIATGDTAARAMATRAFEAIESTLVRIVRLPADAIQLRLVRIAAPPGRGGGAEIPGFLDDYAFLANAALDLFETTQDAKYATFARRLVATAAKLFHDEEQGGFFYTPEGGETLLTRAKDPVDQAMPAGNAALALAHLRLHALDGDPQLEMRARRALEPLAGSAIANPLGFGSTLVALDRLVRGSTDVVVVGAREDPRTIALLDAVKRTYLPHRTLVLVDPADPTTTAAAPALAEGKEPKPYPVAYVCRGRTCSPPVKDAAALAAALRASSGSTP